MSFSGTFLVMITASFLKPLLSTNQSLQLPAANVFSNVLPFEESNMDSDGVSNVLLTLPLPQLLASAKDLDLDMKRQFEPWGGKRQSSKPLKTDENAGRKRQFSPWGGKRSLSKSPRLTDDSLAATDDRLFEFLLNGNKRNFNSWGGKRGFNSWGGKRNSNSDSSRFNSWGGKRNFNSWGGKRNFNAWGGKRLVNDVSKDYDGLAFVPKIIANLENKRQAFNAWGGKRSFNSWGGKRKFNSWGGKRASELEQEPKELNVSEVLFPQIYKDKPIEETETSIF